MTLRSGWSFWGMVALVLLAWRPFVLGLYVDDWFFLMQSSLFSADWSMARWEMLELSQNRPALRVLSWLLTSLVPASPVLLQVMGAIISLVTAISFSWFCEQLLLRCIGPGSHKVTARLSGLLWLAMPIAVPITFWPTGTTALAAAICLFCSAGLVLKWYEAFTLSRAFAVFCLAVWGHLTYEAFYLQYAIVLGLVLILSKWQWRRSLPWISTLTIAQLVSLSFNRYMRHQGADGSRKFDTGFLDVLFHWLDYPTRMEQFSWLGWQVLAVGLFIVACLFALWLLCKTTARSDFSIFDKLLLVIGSGLLFPPLVAISLPLPLSMLEALPLFVPVILFALWKLLFGGSELADSLKRPLSFLFLGLAGLYVVGAMAYAAGNYVIWAQGIGGRSAMVMVFWLSLFLALLLRYARVSNGVVALTLFSLLVATGFRATEWNRSWVMQQDVMVNFPSFPEAALKDSQAHFIFLGPENPGWVPSIETNWQMGSMMRLGLVKERGHASLAEYAVSDWLDRWFVVRQQQSRYELDSGVLRQIDCRSAAIIGEWNGRTFWLINQLDGSGLIGPLENMIFPGCGQVGTVPIKGNKKTPS